MIARIKFSKDGVMRYIGHLDILRFFQKAVRRSGVKAAFSKGYSPHMIMSFAQPLGVGITSRGDYFDLSLDYPENAAAPSASELKDMLNAVMPEGVSVLNVTYLPEDRKNRAMSIVSACGWTVSFDPEVYDAGKIIDSVRSFLEEREILAEIRRKSAQKTVNIRPMIRKMYLPDNDEFKDEFLFPVRLCALLDSGSASNLRPDTLAASYLAYCGMEYRPFSVHIRRDEMYAERSGERESTPASGGLIPLERFGERP